jgi:hypothetical protein
LGREGEGRTNLAFSALSMTNGVRYPTFTPLLALVDGVKEGRSALGWVNAVAERDVAAGVAAEVEAVRAGELGGIPVGGADRRQDPLAGPTGQASIR